MTTTKPFAASGKGAILSLSLVFFVVCTWTSYARWANFEYRTFDLAYYIQAIWQLIHGRFEVSVQGVPLLGNHVEPIVFLIAPLFLVFRHPLVFVVVQNAALASMGPVAFDVGQRLGLNRKSALLLAAALLVTPATGFIALHEFHPEALTAPFLLLMLQARLRGSLGGHLLWLVAVLACKENMALLIAAYCAVHVVLERKRPLAQLRAWYLWPLAFSAVWFLICTKLITPALNSGNIDYLALYDRLGSSAGDILLKTITQPQRIFTALFQSLQGNLLWGLLVPFLVLPLLRPRWLIISTPILLQHLLSWRSSEWMIFFHYAAPLVPLFWIALAESAVALDRWKSFPLSLRRSAPFLVLGACITAQLLLGPARDIAATTANWARGEQGRARKSAFLARIPSEASVLAPIPYLSHLAMREKLYSLHFVLKGLKTLSRAAFKPPPPTDFVLIDYNDSATFDTEAGFYHPAMKTVDGHVIPSSDDLLHEFLRLASWTASSSDELTLLRQGKTEAAPLPSDPSSLSVLQIGTGNVLTGIAKSGGDELTAQGVELRMNWTFQEPRDVIPWMFLKLTPRGEGKVVIIPKGLCAPEATAGPHQEGWHLTSSEIPEGRYRVEALFVDNSTRLWAAKSAPGETATPLLAPAIPLGDLNVTARKDSSRK